MTTISELLKNDRVQNQLALYYLFEYGRKTLKDDNQISKIREQVKAKDEGYITTKDYILQTLDIARDMATLSALDLKKFICKDEEFVKRTKERNEI